MLSKLAKRPFALTTSGNFPRYLPDTVIGLSEERSGIEEG